MASHSRSQRTSRKPAMKFPHLQKKLRKARNQMASKKIRRHIEKLNRPYLSRAGHIQLEGNR
jgi:hypothetical protein